MILAGPLRQDETFGVTLLPLFAFALTCTRAYSFPSRLSFYPPHRTAVSISVAMRVVLARRVLSLPSRWRFSTHTMTWPSFLGVVRRKISLLCHLSARTVGMSDNSLQHAFIPQDITVWPCWFLLCPQGCRKSQGCRLRPSSSMLNFDLDHMR